MDFPPFSGGPPKPAETTQSVSRVVERLWTCDEPQFRNVVQKLEASGEVFLPALCAAVLAL